jgi:hypothetical protein
VLYRVNLVNLAEGRSPSCSGLSKAEGVERRSATWGLGAYIHE